MRTARFAANGARCRNPRLSFVCRKIRRDRDGHAPRPVVWFRPTARILIAGQAPGMRVHLSGRPFDDPSGERLRDWLGLDAAEFYDRDRVAIVPMAFCFPGYDAKGADRRRPRSAGGHGTRG